MKYQLHVKYGDRTVWFERNWNVSPKRRARSGAQARELMHFRDKIMPEARETLRIPQNEPPWSKPFDIRVVLGGPEWKTKEASPAEL